MRAQKRQKVDDANIVSTAENELYQAIINCRWEKSRELLKSNDALRLAKYMGKPDETRACGSTGTLHIACCRNAPLDIVRDLYSVYAPLVERKDDAYATPLTYACSGASGDVIDFLLKHCPRAASTPDYFGRVPLHCAIARRRPPSIVQKLLTTDPASVMKKNRDGETPIDTLFKVWAEDIRTLSQNASLIEENIDVALKFKETLSLLFVVFVHRDMKKLPNDKWLLWVLIYAIKVKPFYIRVLLSTIREECLKVDKEGNFPLHIACAKLPKKKK